MDYLKVVDVDTAREDLPVVACVFGKD